MAIAKYRPTLTMDEIVVIIDALETVEVKTVPVMAALRNLKMYKFKTDMGVNGPASISTGNKPGPVSKVDIIKADIQEEWEKVRKNIPYGQAIEAAKTYKALGIEVPQDIQDVIDSGEEN